MGEETKRVLTAADIEAVSDLKVIEVEVAEWGGSVYLRSLPSNESIELGERMAELPKEKQAEGMFLLLAACLSDAEGAPLFAKPEDARKVLGKRQPDPLIRLQDEALKLLAWKEGVAKNASGEAVPAVSPTA